MKIKFLGSDSALGKVRSKGVARGKGEIPTETEKIVENGVISEGSIFSNKFSINKIKNKNKIEIQFFYRIFIKDFQNFLKISQQFAYFVQTSEKLTHGFLKFFEKSEK